MKSTILAIAITLLLASTSVAQTQPPTVARGPLGGIWLVQPPHIYPYGIYGQPVRRAWWWLNAPPLTPLAPPATMPPR